MPEKNAAQKLLIKPGQRVRFINPPTNLVALLGSLPDGVVFLDDSAGPDELIRAGVTVLFANSRGDLETLLPGLRAAINPDNKIWIAYHKGTSRVKTDINRDTINAYIQTLRMQGVAMVSIDDDWSALRIKVI
jgi:hypothetical protein